MREEILIWGAGAHARVVADIVRLENRYRIVAFLDDVNPDRGETHFCQAPLYLDPAALEVLRREGIQHMIVAIGDCDARLQRAGIAREHGFSLITAIHPWSVIASGVSVGEGSVIAPGAVIAPEVKLGDNVIVNTCASVDHDSILEDGAHVSAGARVGGRVSVGEAAFIGMAATLLTDVRIGERAFIGAGALVLKDVPARTLAYGVPARLHGQVGTNGK